MAGTVDVTYSDLVARFGAELPRQVFCDDGSGTPGPRLTTSLRSGRRLADTVLLKAWTREQIEVLVAEDDAIRGAILDIVISDGMLGRLQWESETGMRVTLRKQGIDTLKMLVSSELESVGSEVAGKRMNTEGVRVGRVPASFSMAPSKSRPTRGGF